MVRLGGAYLESPTKRATTTLKGYIMKILTVGACPYLLTHLGRMNAALIEHLVDNGHEVQSAVWHLDTSWFLPDKDDKFYYEKNGKKLCVLRPFYNQPVETATPQLYEIIREAEPDVVVSLSNYTDIAPLYAIKALDPKMIKWVSVIASAASPINDEFFEAIKMADTVFATRNQTREEIVSADIPCTYQPFGPNHGSFYSLASSGREEDCLRIMGCAKNSQSSNIGAFMEAAKIIKSDDIKVYLHVNHSSTGDYELRKLNARYGNAVALPDSFISINEGIPDEELNKEYNKSDIVVDVSVRSSTALSVLEAMCSGCIPIISPVGALKELGEMIKEYECFPRSIRYVGDNGENYEIVDPNSLAELLEYFCNFKKERKKEFEELRCKMIEVSSAFCSKKFVEEIEKTIKEIDSNDRTISVDVI